MTESPLLVETIDDHIGLVTFNRPAKHNALSYDVVRLLDEAITRFEDNPAIRCVVITGAGDKAFSAGADIHEQVEFSPDEYQDRLERRAQFLWHLANSTKPTIGAINGLAYGGAAALATTLDIRIGCERSKFRFLGASYGRINSTWSLPLLVGWAAAKELLFTARVVSPEEALQLGLLNKVVPSGELRAAALAMAAQIAGNNPETVRGLKEILHADIGATLGDMYANERRAATTTHRPGPPEEAFADFLARGGDGKA
jgi:enoyl-CoA hydratase/carnithine racemase